MKTPSGLEYLETEPGKGAQAVAGKTVKVHYTGKLTNGKVFDSSIPRGEPIEFVLGAGVTGAQETISASRQRLSNSVLTPLVFFIATPVNHIKGLV